MVDKVLKAILLLSPICFTTGLHLDLLNLIFFHLAFLLLLAASFFDKPKRYVNNIFFGAILIFLIFHVFWHDFNSVILSAVMNVSIGIMGIHIIALYASENTDFEKYIVMSGLINIFVLSLQFSGYSPMIDIPRTGESGGMMGSAPRLAMYLTMTLPFALKMHWFIALIYILTCLIIKEISILYLVILIGIWKFQKNKFVVIGFIIIGLLGSYFYLDKIIFSFSLRWQAWGPTIEMISGNFLKGYGLGLFPIISDQFIISKLFYADTAFSSILQLIFAVGVFGSGLMLLFFHDFIKNIKFEESNIAIISLIILSIIEYPFQVPRLWPTIIFIIAFYLIKKGTLDNEYIKN